MAASVPEREIPFAVTVFPVPIVFVANVAVPVTVKSSPKILVSEYTTLAAVVLSYTLLLEVIVTVTFRGVMFAVVVAVVFGV